MRRFPTIIVSLLLLGATLFAQGPLKLQGNALQVISGLQNDLRGEFSALRFSPYPSQLFSFERRHEDGSYLYIYNLSRKNLTEIRTIQPAMLIASEVNYSQSLVNNNQLDWRPLLDKNNRQWFTFVSNGAEDNRDIYLGYQGGSEYIRLTSDRADDDQPRWSPDGSALAFVSNRTGYGDIYLLEDLTELLDAAKIEKPLKPRQLTRTALEETDLSWNPNVKSGLLAYARKERFEGRPVETFQIYILDVRRSDKNTFAITDDPLYHYTRPAWDPHEGSKLLYVGQSLVDNLSAHLYLSEVMWDKDGNIRNKVLPGYKTQLFTDVRLSGTPARWLAGGEAIIAQQERPQVQNPLYSINVQRWLDKKAQAVNVFQELHDAHPDANSFDIRKNHMLFVTRRSGVDRIYLAQMYRDDIVPFKDPQYTLNRMPIVQRSSGNTTKYLLAGGALAGGVAAYLLLRSDDETATIQSLPIGRPPSLP